MLDSIKKTYASTTERLGPLLEKHEITYKNLRALFKPNMVLYATCAGTGKPRCVKFDFGEERKQANGVEYFHMGCRYLDFDGKVFGEASTALGIEKFRGKALGKWSIWCTFVTEASTSLNNRGVRSAEK